MPYTGTSTGEPADKYAWYYPEPLPERFLYWEFGKQVGDPNSGVVGEVFQAARRGPWKAVRYGHDAPIQLFQLENDPGETQDLYAEREEVSEAFAELFASEHD